MSYSLDLRQRVLEFVRQGGSKAEAARLFGVSRGRIFVWLKLPPEELAGRKPGPKKAHKLDLKALEDAIQEHPDRLQTELAQQFGVTPSAIHYARRRLGITRKKRPSAIQNAAPANAAAFSNCENDTEDGDIT